MAKYEPNWGDPRVKRRIESAILFVETYLKSNEIKPVAQTQITKHFGFIGRPLARYLKGQLLTVKDSYSNQFTGQCKRYTRNQQGYLELKQASGIIEIKHEIPASIIAELESGNITYVEKSDRAYHSFQSKPKRVKRITFKATGYNYEYDIECAAQTFLKQESLSLGHKIPTPAFDSYLGDRKLVRNQLSNELNLPQETIKKILHAMLNGASISPWHANSIFALVNFNRLMIDQLKSNTWIQQYKKEVRSMWDSIRPQLELSKGVRFSSKLKGERYRSNETLVRTTIQRYMKKTKNKCYFEHDGWTCARAIDTTELIQVVKRTTGFTVKLDWIIYE
jgi:hypothetical protein